MDMIVATDELIEFIVDGEIYSETVIFKTIYWLAPIASFDISKFPPKSFLIAARPNAASFSEEIKKEIEVQLRKGLVDFKVRDLINQETNSVRSMIIAKAFDNDGSLDIEPQSQISDPIGFDPIR
ncbi:His-Xaa-Ser system protein HxsD [Dyadobacter crusticola]|uniref:His-Xaa-Ser system protein HxsD n=1 Tax=Dyadobacter crusticola TaxID=292407 RepID=UPI00054D5268|nr:His-Xaa-Ser system protein HxsD [Dyadobacter crusticola]